MCFVFQMRMRIIRNCQAGPYVSGCFFAFARVKPAYTQGMLTQFAPDVWLSEGPEIRAALGFHYPIRMVTIRLAGGGLWLWSPIERTPELANALEALGPVTHLIAPNTLHHMHVGPWQEAHPEAQLHGPPGLARKRQDLRFDTELGTIAPPEWRDEIEQVIFDNKLVTEIVFFHRPSRTLLVTDLIQSLPRDWYTGWRRLVARADKMCEPGGTMPRKFRVGFRDRPATRAAWQRIRNWAPERLIMAHGAPVTTGLDAVLEDAFGWLG